MTSINNLAMRRQQLGEQKPVYGLRKLSMGFGSVLLGTMLYSGMSPAIHADVLPTGEQNVMNNDNSTSSQSEESSPSVEGAVAAQPMANAVNQPVESNFSSVTEAAGTAGTTNQNDLATATQIANQIAANINQGNSANNVSSVVNNAATPASNSSLVNATVTPANGDQGISADNQLVTSQPTINSNVESSVNKVPNFTMVLGAKRGQVGYQISTEPDRVLDNYSIAKGNNGNYQVGLNPNGNYSGMLTIPNLADVQGRYKDASRVTFNFDSLNRANLGLVTGLSFSGTNGQKVMLVGSLRRVLENMRNLRTVDLTNTDTTGVTDLNNAFSNLPLLQTVNLANSDFNQVTNADSMFANDRALQLVTGWNHLNFSNVQSMDGMFENTPNLQSIDFSGINISNKLESVHNLFNRSGVKQINFGHMNLAGVTDFSGAFANTTDLNQINNLSSLETISAENLAHLFDGSNLNSIDMNWFNGQHVKDLSLAFANMPNLTQISNLAEFEFENHEGGLSQIESLRGVVMNDPKLTSFDMNGFARTTNLVDLTNAFRNTGLRVVDLSTIDPINVKSMANVACDNPNLTLIMLGNQFNAPHVINLEKAFANNPKLTSFNMASFKAGSNVNANNMFAGDNNLKSLTGLKGIKPINRDQMLNGLNQSLVQSINQYNQNLDDHVYGNQRVWTRTVHITINNGNRSYTLDVPQSAHASWDTGAFPTGLKLPDLKLSDYKDKFADAGIELTPEQLNIVVPGVTLSENTPAKLPDVDLKYGDGQATSLTKQIQLIDDDWQSGMTNANGQPLKQIVKTLTYNLKSNQDIVDANVDGQIPAGYELNSGSYPGTLTVQSPDSQQVHIHHKIDDNGSSTKTFTRHYVGVDDNTGATIFDHWIQYPVVISGAGKDEVTGKVVGGEFPDGKYSIPPYDPSTDTNENSDGSVIADIVKNYQLVSDTSAIPAESLTSTSPADKTITIHYKDNNSSNPGNPSIGDKQVVITFVDDDWKAGMKDKNGNELKQNPSSFTVNVPAGAYNVPTNVKDHVPAGYVIVGGHYLTAVDGSITSSTVHLKHILKEETTSQNAVYKRIIKGIDQDTGKELFEFPQQFKIPYQGMMDEVTGLMSPDAFPTNLSFPAVDPTSNPEVKKTLDAGGYKWVSGSADKEAVTSDTPLVQTVNIYYKSSEGPVTPTQKNAVHLQIIDLDRNGEVEGGKTLANLDVGSNVDVQSYYENGFSDKYLLDGRQNKLEANGSLSPYVVTGDKDQVVKIYVHHRTETKADTRTIHRRIYLMQADGSKKLLEDQTAHTNRDVTIDLTDGSKKNGDWSSISFDEYDVPSDLLTNDNDQPISQSQVPEDDLDNDQINQISNINDPKADLSVGDVILSYGNSDGTVNTTVVFKTADGEIVDDNGMVTGKAGSKVDLTDPQYAINVPQGYELDKGQSMTITLGNSDGEVDILVHAKILDVTDNPDYQDQINAVSETGQRKIRFIDAETNAEVHPSITQIEHFTRRAIANLATGDITYTPWKLASDSTNPNKAQFDSVDLPTVAGYTVVSNQTVKAQTVDPDNLNTYYSDVVIQYQKNDDVKDITATLNFKTADGTTIASQMVSGVAGKSIEVTDIPEGYHLVNGKDNQVTLSQDGQNIDILVAPDKQNPDNPGQPSEQTGTINYVDKSGKVIASQQVKAPVGQEFDVTEQFAVPTGYKLIDDSDKMITLSQTGNNVFNITVVPTSSKPGEQTLSGIVNYVTDDQTVVGTGTISGKPGQVFDVTNQVKLPDGYEIAEPGSQNVSLTQDHQTITVKVQKVTGDQTMQGTIFFIDHDTKQLVGTGLVTGKPGQSFDISGQVPDNYQLTNSTDGQLTLVSGQNQYRVEISRVSMPDPESEVIYLQFKDGKQNVGSAIDLKGKIGDLIDWTKQASIPANYELVNDDDRLPVQITHKNQIITIKLKHKLQANPMQTIQRNLIYDLYLGDSKQPFNSIVKKATGQVISYKDLVTGKIDPNIKITWTGGNIAENELTAPKNYHLVTDLTGIDSAWLPTNATASDLKDLTTDGHIKLYYGLIDSNPVITASVSLKATDLEQASPEIEQKLNEQITSAFNGVLKPYNLSKEHTFDDLVAQLQTALTLQVVQERLKDVVPSIDATNIKVVNLGDNQIELQLQFKHHHDQSTDQKTATEFIQFESADGTDLGNAISESLPVTVTTDKDEVTGITKTTTNSQGQFSEHDLDQYVKQNFAGYHIDNVKIDNSSLLSGHVLNSFKPNNNQMNVSAVVILAKDNNQPDNPGQPSSDRVDKTIEFVDDNGNVVGKQLVSGKAGTKQAVTYQVPAGYYINNDAKGMMITFDHNEVIKIAVKKTIASISKVVNFVDTANGQTIASVTLEGATNSQQSLQTMIPNGYELVNVSNMVVTLDNNNPVNVQVQKKATPQMTTRTIVYVTADGQIVGRQLATATTGMTQDVVLTVPKGYKYDKAVESITFDTDSDYMITVVKDNSGQSTTPTKPDHGNPDQSTTPTNPTTPGKPDHGNPDQSITPTNPTTPGKPDHGNPDQSTTPTNPVTPGKPDHGSSDQSTTPTNPTTPGKPDHGSSDQPTTPTNPTTPGKPDHGKPDQPTTPANPTTSGKSDHGNQSTLPVNPTEPVSPNHGDNSHLTTPDNSTESDNSNDNQTTSGNSIGSNVVNGNYDQLATNNGSVSGISSSADSLNNSDSSAGLTNISQPGTTDAGEQFQVATGNSTASSNNQLPQTGSQQTNAVLALGAFTAMFGLGLLKKKRED